MRVPLGALRVLLLSTVLVATSAPAPAAASVVSDADHWQVCQGNDHDENAMTSANGDVCVFAGLNWVVPGSFALPNGAYVSDNTGATGAFVQVVAQLIHAGVSVPGDHSQPIVYPGSGTDVNFINGDEDYPSPLLNPSPIYASGGTTLASDCVARTSDSPGGGTFEYNTNVAADSRDVAATYVLKDALRDLTAPTAGELYVFETGGPLDLALRAQSPLWVSNVLEAAAPSTLKDVRLQVEFDSLDGCTARGPTGPTLGPALALNWAGVVSDLVVFGS